MSLEDMMLHLTNLDSLVNNSNNRALVRVGIGNSFIFEGNVGRFGLQSLDRTIYIVFLSKSFRSILQYNEQDYSVATFMYSCR